VLLGVMSYQRELSVKIMMTALAVIDIVLCLKTVRKHIESRKKKG